MSPNQIEAANRSIEEIQQLAKAVKGVPAKRRPEEFISVIRVLRDEKHLSWDDIKDWMRDNTEFNRSGANWAKIYKNANPRLQ